MIFPNTILSRLDPRKPLTEQTDNLVRAFQEAPKSTLGLLLGSRDGTEVIPPSKLIAPPSKAEKRLLEGILPIAEREANTYYSISNLMNPVVGYRDVPIRIPMPWGGGSWQFNIRVPIRKSLLQQGVERFMSDYDRTLRKLRSLADTTTGLLSSEELRIAERAARGELPQSFEDMIRNQFSRQVGGILNTMASRGIINSSVAQNAISQALQNTLAERARYLPLVQGLALRTLQQKASLIPLAERATLQPLRFGVGAPIGLWSTLRDIQKDYLSFPANLYTQMMSARHSVRGMPVVKRGSPGLLGPILGIGGAILGGLLGGPLGAYAGYSIGSGLGYGISAGWG